MTRYKDLTKKVELTIKKFDDYYDYYLKNYSSIKFEEYSEEIWRQVEENIYDPIRSLINDLRIYEKISYLNDEKLTRKEHEDIQDRRLKYEYLKDRHRENKARNEQYEIKTKIDEIDKAVEDVKAIKNNLFNIFSFMIGLLGFIFINFNIFNEIGVFSVEKIITVVLMLNMSFVSGIIILMNMFRNIFFKQKDEDIVFGFWFIVLYLLINMVLIFFLMKLKYLKAIFL